MDYTILFALHLIAGSGSEKRSEASQHRNASVIAVAGPARETEPGFLTWPSTDTATLLPVEPEESSEESPVQTEACIYIVTHFSASVNTSVSEVCL